MIDLQHIKSLYFVGIGGIGMSALARFFKKQGKVVVGYDRTETDLTIQLVSEGISCNYADDISLIDQEIFLQAETLVVYTPAIPLDNNILNWFVDHQFQVLKRSQLLGVVSDNWDAICVAGTHGKTTVSTMVSHLLTQSPIKCHAFIGGISKNYNTNYLQAEESNYVVIEADEFDRSFLTLNPSLALVTSVDADHLDIYDSKQNIIDAFEAFLGQVRSGGSIVIRKNLDIKSPDNIERINVYQYSLDEESDFYAKNLNLNDGFYQFDLVHPNGVIENLELGVPGLINVENAVGASALALLSGVDEVSLRNGLSGFKGIKRRFDYWLKNDELSLIDDYAHHPEEIKATAKSIKAIYPDKKVIAVFQPHLYSRTNDFYADFAKALSIFDEVILLDIYPARELPIEGVTSELIANGITTPVTIVEKEMLGEEILKCNPEVVVIMGAGDIDKELPKIKKFLEINKDVKKK